MSGDKNALPLNYARDLPLPSRRLAGFLDILALVLAFVSIWFTLIFTEGLHATIILVNIAIWGLLAGSSIAILCLRKTILLRHRRVHSGVFVILLLSGGWGILSLYDAFTAIDPHIPARNVVYCQSHLQTLYGAMQLYAAEHNGLCPDSLMVLAQKELNDGDEINEFVSPAGQPQGYYGPQPTTQQILDEIQGNSPTFVYLAKGMNFPPSASTVLIYDAARDHTTRERGGDGIHVLYGDGIVKWLEGRAKRAFLKQIEAQTASTKTN